MSLLNEIYIGTYAGGVDGMVPVSSLGQGVYSTAIQEGAFTVDPVSYSRIASTASGAVVEQGWKQAAWHINGLRAEQYDAIEAYKISITTPLYIRTLEQNGKTYANYLCDSIWQPIINRGDPTAVEAGAVFDFELRFIKMIKQAEYS